MPDFNDLIDTLRTSARAHPMPIVPRLDYPADGYILRLTATEQARETMIATQQLELANMQRQMDHLKHARLEGTSYNYARIRKAINEAEEGARFR